MAGITEYILIGEPEAVALEYGYYMNLSHQFDEKPMTVLFIGVGYAASQAFVVQYTKVFLSDDTYDLRTISRFCITLHRLKCPQARLTQFFWTLFFNHTMKKRAIPTLIFAEMVKRIIVFPRGY